MARPVTLFTGQWADLTLEELARKCGEWGFDGLELACWGDHFDVDRALSESDYIEGRWEILRRNDLSCWAISNHLVGQAVCDPIDARHQATLPPDVWGDGDPQGVRRRAAEKMKDTARAAARFGVTQVNGFTGSSIWHLLYSFPPNDFAEIERGYEDFAERWTPIIDVFDEEGVRWGLEVHPTEIAYDFVTTRKALDAIGNREGFGINFDPSHFAHQFLDSAAFVEEFADRIYHVHVKDSRKSLDGRRSILGGHLNFGESGRGWDFVSPGHGDVDFESLFRALNRIGYEWPLPLVPRLVAIAGRTEEAVAEAARRYGFEGYATDWRELVSQDGIQLFDNSGPNNLHAEPTIAAAEAGKHVVCEKPLARTADESYEVWQRVAAAGVKHMCAFNYRFVPAVRLARELLEAGDLGDIYHFRGSYLQEWGDIDDQVWRFERATAGSGALGDLGAHVLDLARYLVGEVKSVSGGTRTFKEGRDVDDAFEAVVEFEGGAIGTVEASRFCPGRKNAFTWEINGSKGSIAFDLERLNELQVNLRGSKPGERAQGFRDVLVSEADHPFWEHWWPHGHIIGWEHSFVHEIHHLLSAIAEDGDVAPHGATCEDGYRAAEVCDAIVRSSESGRREEVPYR